MKINLSVFKKPIQNFDQEELSNKFLTIKNHYQHKNKCLNYFCLSNIVLTSTFLFNTMGRGDFNGFSIIMSILLGALLGFAITLGLLHFAEFLLNKTLTFKKMKNIETLLIEDLALKLEEQDLQFSLLKTLEEHILELTSFQFKSEGENDTKNIYLKDINSVKENLLLFFSEGNFKDAANYLLNYETISSIENSYKIYEKLDKLEYSIVSNSIDTNEDLKKYKEAFAKFYDNKIPLKLETENEYNYRQHF